MRELIIWIIILGFIVGGFQINKDPNKTSAKFKNGEEVTVVIGSDEIDATIKSYLSIKIRWFSNSKINHEMYTITYKDKVGVLHDKTVKTHMVKERKNENPYNLYEYKSEN